MAMKKTALQIWNEEADALRARMPKVCENCRHHWPEREGYCDLHDATPPDDFAETPDACPDWKDVVPF
jgi:hypothetical protein